ncbi:hypothetical protein [Streptomyces sp. YGL11-2]|uniref:hypothetical protein n=1 Tax=Streptomyces sp. YGL11-2 TaxID=3414028 RepID=UPI003CEF1395
MAVPDTPLAADPDVELLCPEVAGVSQDDGVRCSMLHVDPHERPRLEEIWVNLIARIAEAEREGRLGEVAGLSVSLAGRRPLHRRSRQQLETVYPTQQTINSGDRDRRPARSHPPGPRPPHPTSEIRMKSPHSVA